jgi:hypothetical protein
MPNLINFQKKVKIEKVNLVKYFNYPCLTTGFVAYCNFVYYRLVASNRSMLIKSFKSQASSWKSKIPSI